MEQITNRRAVKWAIWTTVTPLGLSLFAANFYIAAWFVRMAMAGTPHQGAPPFPVVQRGVLLTAGVGLWLTVFLWWFLQRKQASFSALFRTRTERIGGDLGVGLILGGIWVGIYGLIGWPSFSAMFVLDHAKLVSLPASLSAGFCEEFLFRGFLIGLIARAGGRSMAQVAWSSVAFGLAHIMWGPIGVLFTVALGVSFALVTLRRGNVWAAVVAHSILDLCIEPGLMDKAIASGFQSRP